MHVHRSWALLLAGVVAGLALPPAMGQRPSLNPDEVAIRKRGEAYVEAFNKGDAKAATAFWTADADFIDQAGRQVSGRAAIEAYYQAFFAANKGAKLKINPTSTRFVKPDCAIDDGTTEVTPGDGGPPTTARFTAVLVKQDGQWFLASVRESEAAPPSNHEHLQELEWLIGDWIDEAGKAEVASASYTWAENQNFIVSASTVTLKEAPVAGQTQWIGWDAAAKRIRSWSFQSNGGFTEGAWTRDGSKWTIKSTATLQDGKKMSATNTLTLVDADHFTWQSTQRSLDGQAMPDTPVIKMKRAK